MSVFDKLFTKKVSNYKVTLRNFLSWMLFAKEKYANMLNMDYSLKERNEFIYNCAICTINDFFCFEKYYSNPQKAMTALTSKFEENFKLREFAKVELADEVPTDALGIIKQFECIKDNLSDTQKNLAMSKTNEILTSAN